MTTADDQFPYRPRQGTASSKLQGKQSVRATFKLSEECIGAISIVAAHLGIKQKSLFDHLVEDIQALHAIAGELQNAKLKKHSRIQKTYVISRKSLNSLDEISKIFNAPRDALVEYSVQRLLPVIVKEKQRHKTRKEIFGKVSGHFHAGLQLLDTIKRRLGPDDPLFSQMAAQMTQYETTVDAIEAIIEKGRVIETFDPSMLEIILTAED
jgi:hypothetical protein